MNVYYFIDYIHLEKNIETIINVPEHNIQLQDMEVYAKPVKNNIGHSVYVSDIKKDKFTMISNFSGIVKWVIVAKRVYDVDYDDELIYRCHEERYNIV